jgi:hypothetical protein
MCRKRNVAAVSLAVSLVVCGGLIVGAGLVVKNLFSGRPCVPPPYEETLIAAYADDQLLTAGRPTESAGPPDVRHFCDLVGVEHIHPLSYTEVTYKYPAMDWQTALDLKALYQANASAEGWAYTGSRNDDAIAAVHFCRSINGVTSTLTIALLRGDITGGPVIDARQIVSVPIHAVCPFQADLWGPSYRP